MIIIKLLLLIYSLKKRGLLIFLFILYDYIITLLLENLLFYSLKKRATGWKVYEDTVGFLMMYADPTSARRIDILPFICELLKNISLMIRRETECMHPTRTLVNNMSRVVVITGVCVCVCVCVCVL